MQVQKEEIRNSILEAALFEFKQQGYEKATMSEIANRCKISKSNLYRYFTSKKEIYLILMAPAMSDLRITMKYLTSDVFNGISYEIVAKTMADSIYQFICKYKCEMAVIMNTKLDDELQSFKEEMTQYIVKNFSSIDSKRMPFHLPEVLASMLMDGINHIIESTDDNEAIYDQLLALFRYHARGIYVFLQ